MKTLAVHLEGTLTDDELTQKPDPVTLEVLFTIAARGQWRIYVVTPKAQTTRGLQMVQRWLLDHAVPFDEVWAAWGYPEADHVINNRAIRVNASADNVLKRLAT